VLWIALHLPLLSLESFAATVPRAPCAPGEGSDEDLCATPAQTPPLALLQGGVVQGANAAARALGVQPGLKRATALALAPQIVLGQADPRRDARALEAVAHAALAFTPQVSIQPSAGGGAGVSHTVVLEVQASLRCFGGLPSLLQRLQEALRPLGHRLHIASAATPQAAALLAQWHAAVPCGDLAATRRALAGAPASLLGDVAAASLLSSMGLHSFADLRRVPRDGLARRFGQAFLDRLDRALGTQADPREPLCLPPVFDSRLELGARADTTAQLMHGAARLLAQLVAWLSAQQAFVRRFTLELEHERRSRRDGGQAALSTLDLALAQPSRDSTYLLVLLRERLAGLSMPAPTLALRLHAHDVARCAPPNTELFPTPASEQEGLTRLIERLQARLGVDQVMHLVSQPDHRPECGTGWRAVDAGAPRTFGRPLAHVASAASASPVAPHTPASRPARPVWLLVPPQALGERQHQPWLGGHPLQLLSGPERIESGWWDDALAERDYFIAQQANGALVWIYRRRQSGRDTAPAWFLQGRFA
jgi:protein ImuB